MSRGRVDRLLALATNASTPPEEARTAAMIACRLIVEGKMLGAGPAPGQVKARGPKYNTAGEQEAAWAKDPAWKKASAPRNPFGFGQEIADMLDELQRATGRRVAREHEKRAEWTHPSTGPSPFDGGTDVGFRGPWEEKFSHAKREAARERKAKTSPDPATAKNPNRGTQANRKFVDDLYAADETPESRSKRAYAQGWDRTFGKEPTK